MSNQFYSYLSNILFDYFDENPLKKGDRFYIQFDEPSEVKDFQNSIREYAEENSSCVPFTFTPEYGDEFSTFSVKLKDIQSNDIYFVIVGNPDINEDYYVTLRNRVGSQNGVWENTALLIIYNEAKDSIFEGMGNLASKNMPLNVKSISRKIENRLENDEDLEKVDRVILDFSITKLNEDLSEITIWDYESILSIIQNGEINYEEDLLDLRLFPDKSLSDFNVDTMKKRLNENYSFFDKVEICKKSGNEKEELKKLFKEKCVKKFMEDKWYRIDFKDVKECEPITDGVCLYEENPNKLTNEGLLYWEKAASGTKAGQRRRHIIIFNDKNFDKVSIDFSFDCWTRNKYLLGGSDRYASSSGKKLKVEFEVSRDKPTYRRINYHHNFHNKSHYYFYILVINSASDIFDSIKSNYTISNGRIVVIDDEDEIRLGCGEDVIEEKIEEENQKIKLNDDKSVIISDESPAWEQGDLTFELELKFNGNIIPFLIKSNTKKPRPVKSYEIWNLKRQYKENFIYVDEKAIQGVNKVYLEDKFKDFLDMERQIICKKIFYGIKDINGKIIDQDVEFSEELKDAYSAILEYFETFSDTPESNLPSLFYLNDDLKELYENFIYIFNKEISEIENSSILANIKHKKDLSKLGRIDDDNRIMYSSLSPINIAYQLEISNQCSGEEFARSISERLVPNNLIPYIFSDKDELFRPVYQNIAHEWLVFEKNEEVSIGTTNAFISNVVSEKLKQFVDHFGYLFNVNLNSPIKVNIININDDLEIVKGISKFIRSRLSDNTDNVIPVVINVYNSIGISSFDEFLNCNSIAEAKSNYELDVSSNSLDKLDVLRDVQNNISYYIHDINEGNYEYAHISFYKVTSGASNSVSDMDKMVSGLSLNGLISSVSSTTTPSGYRTGFGTKEIANKDNILVKSAININEIIKNSKNRGIDDYAKNKAIVTNVTLNDEHIEELYKKSRWVTFIEPTFGIEYFDNSDSLIIIHYSDQYTSSNNYDTITVTNKDSQYKEAIQRFLKEKGITNILKDDLQDIIKLFNSINGEWLLNIIIKKGQYTREKLSVISAIKYALAILDHKDIIWIPISLEEILRITRNLKLDKSQGVISSFVEQGSYSDDLLLIGVNISDEDNLRVYYHPIEVKVGKNNSSVINTGEYQLKRTYELLYDLLNQNSTKFINKFFRNFFIQQLYSNQHKLTVNGVWDEKKFNRLEKYKSKLLNDEFTISYDLERVISRGTLMSFKEDCSFEKIIKNDNNQRIELREDRVYRTLSKSVKDLFNEIQNEETDIFRSSLLSCVSNLDALEHIPAKTVGESIELENRKPDELDLRNIIVKENSYQIYNRVNGKNKCFGTFDSLEDAIEARDDLISRNWEIGHDEDSQIPERKGKYGKFISFNNGYYSVVKVVNNQRKSFGLFKKQEDAVKLRDLLIENEWDFTKIPPEFLTDNFKFRFSNIREKRGKFIISKVIDGELKYFGTFDTKAEAIAHRNNLILNNWQIDNSADEEKVDEFVYFVNGEYIVKNEVDGEEKIFGRFDDGNEAIQFRNYCVKVNWKLE